MVQADMTSDKSYELKIAVQELQSLRQEKEELERKASRLEIGITQANEKAYDLLVQMGLKSATLDGVGHVSLGQSDYPRTIDADALFASLESLGASSLIKRTVHSQTLRAFCKERKDQNLPLPDGVEVFTKRYVKVKGV